MKYYIGHFFEHWIIEFDDETKKWGIFIKGEVEDFEAEELDIIDGGEIAKNGDGMVVKLKGGSEYKRIRTNPKMVVEKSCVCENDHRFKSRLPKMDVVCPDCGSLNVDFLTR